jgi:NTP pyrophosphatase (non-canonical NTP hydrolase)
VEALKKDISEEDEHVPELTNFEAELADVAIRLMDLACACEVDLDRAVYLKQRYNESRPFKHGKKF